MKTDYPFEIKYNTAWIYLISFKWIENTNLVTQEIFVPMPKITIYLNRDYLSCWFQGNWEGIEDFDM